jgi:hypothetical protein
VNVGERPGPFNMPITVRAQIQDEHYRPVTAEATLEIVAD